MKDDSHRTKRTITIRNGSKWVKFCPNTDEYFLQLESFLMQVEKVLGLEYEVNDPEEYVQ